MNFLSAFFALDDNPLPPEAEVSFLHVSREAMATSFSLMLPTEIPFAQLAANDALDLVDELESQLTVYRPESELSQLNQRAFSESIPVEMNLFQLLETTAHLTQQTHGAFDIATGALIKAWGFYRRQGRVPSVKEQATAMQSTGMRFVVLDGANRRVRYLRPGLELNLGGIGKGYTLDQVSKLLQERWGISTGLIHGGSSSVLALGPHPSHPRGWGININHPWDSTKKLGTIWLKNRAVGTSAATHQHFEYNGKKLGHLLDPRTGWPAEGMQSVTVVAPTATLADALSTAFYILGVEKTVEFCRQHPSIGAVLLPNEADVPLVLNLNSHELTLA